MSLSIGRVRDMLVLALLAAAALAGWHSASADADTQSHNYTDPGTYSLTIPTRPAWM